jgi:dihydroxyacetone kinase
LDIATDATISELCNAMSEAFLEAVGASAGPRYAAGFQTASKAVSNRLNLDAVALAAWISGIADGIESRGGAQPGEKTMVDAWRPAATAAQYAARAGASVPVVLRAATAAARAGMLATTDMLTARGRATKLGERAKGHIDPGAASAVTILDAMQSAHPG